MRGPAVPWRSDASGLVLSVRLTPRSDREAIDGIAQLADGKTVLQVRVRAPPSDGLANAALVRLIAAALGVRPREVSLVAGESARLKRVKISGSAAALAVTLAKICTSPASRAVRTGPA
jgi:uncharacterized protein